jgi:hypothetical protein
MPVLPGTTATYRNEAVDIRQIAHHRRGGRGLRRVSTDSNRSRRGRHAPAVECRHRHGGALPAARVAAACSAPYRLNRAQSREIHPSYTRKRQREGGIT